MDTLRDRRNRLAAALLDLADAEVTPARLAQVAARLVGFGDAAITVGDSTSPHLVAAHGPLASNMEDLQRRLGEGPTLAAFATNSPVLATVVEPESSRWPAFDAQALGAGITSVLALPLRPRRTPPAALSLYSTSTDPLDDDRVGDALLVADLVAETLVNPTADGLRQRLAQVGDDSSVVHHATGIVAARHSLSPAEALSSLRSQAGSSRITIGELAAQIAAHLHEPH